METLSENKNLRVVAEIELIYKTKVKASERPVISSSKTVYEVLLNSWDRGQIELREEFKILLLNNSNKVLGLYEVSKGGITGTIVDKRLIFAAALKANACALVLAHNHPSGSLIPSAVDKDITRGIREAGQTLGIKVLDHLIVTTNGYYSFADEGLL